MYLFGTCMDSFRHSHKSVINKSKKANFVNNNKIKDIRSSLIFLLINIIFAKCTLKKSLKPKPTVLIKSANNMKKKTLTKQFHGRVFKKVRKQDEPKCNKFCQPTKKKKVKKKEILNKHEEHVNTSECYNENVTK